MHYDVGVKKRLFNLHVSPKKLPSVLFWTLHIYNSWHTDNEQVCFWFVINWTDLYLCLRVHSSILSKHRSNIWPSERRGDKRKQEEGQLAWVQPDKAKLQQSLSLYICVYMESAEACKNARHITTRPSFYSVRHAWTALFPSLLPLLHPSEPIKTEQDNELHNSNFCIIVSLSGSVPSAIGDN